MSEVAIPEENNHQPFADSPLVRWAYEARQAAAIAVSLSKTSFVPNSLRGKAEDIAAAILAGQELGLKPMATLRSMDVIQGTPALRAHAMRGLLQSQGHEVELVESTETRCKMRGRRKGADKWQDVTWTAERAKKLGLTEKGEWRKQPQTMLIARATGEICRLVASDVLYAMPYTAEELDDDLAPLIVDGAAAAREATKRIARRAPLPAAPEPNPEPALEEDSWPTSQPPNPTPAAPTVNPKTPAEPTSTNPTPAGDETPSLLDDGEDWPDAAKVGGAG